MTNRFCRGARSYFSDHLDGQPIPFWRGLMVRMHLSICPQCKLFNRSLVATREALHALRDAEVEPDPKLEGGRTPG